MNWFEMWVSDMESILETMVRNMVSDIECGYNPHGNCIMKQNAAITEYKARFDKRMKQFREMTPQQVSHWCYMDLRRRGAIS